MTERLFWFFAALAVGAALLMVTMRNLVACALWLIQVMLALAALFVLLHAQFIGAIQVLVYAGAVMVLFLFVIMLLNLSRAESDLRRAPAWFLALIMVGLLASQLVPPLSRYTRERLALEYTDSPVLANPAIVFDSTAFASGNHVIRATLERGIPGDVAKPMFEQYLVPFELTSVLLLAAIVGAVVLAKRRI
ncbi:MAG TPA: NADH-quinone oxidoreductase subunit J [Gemmatimonadales bacterium]|jgi:NADH-quinone oxidoreductase subunit J|nr:NADH-quinone oxidoreductase subunit J [Gemmatimonadales bacterium]